ncbi:hypothetical protein CDD83_5878 [Cordyceps sp. RAO-2017]|nr:hypothetical protein CDD83_5878 [Cordyceps sp. RAO-2017]
MKLALAPALLLLSIPNAQCLSGLIRRFTDTWKAEEGNHSPLPRSAFPSAIPNGKHQEPIPIVPAPWTLKGDVYIFGLWSSSAEAERIPHELAYSPLEASSSFADDKIHKPAGGVGMIQIIRYRESPVGPYDELIIMPGNYDWERQVGEQHIRGRNPKITRIYVSQERTCYNGRRNWNIPKHLAKFDWAQNQDGSVSVQVYPYDTTGDVQESFPSSTPFFQATLAPVGFLPSFPFSTKWADYIGFNTSLVMPPLPQGRGSRNELPGTDHWRSVSPRIDTQRASLVMFDLAQRNQQGEITGQYENFWPGLKRRKVGLKLNDATLSFPVADEW